MRSEHENTNGDEAGRNRFAGSGHRTSAPSSPPSSDAAGRVTIAHVGHGAGAPASDPERDAAGHSPGAADGGRSTIAPASQPDRAGGQAGHARKGQITAAAERDANIDDRIEEITIEHRRRCFAQDQRKRADLALGAHLRTMLGWRKSLPEAERKRIAKQAHDLMEIGEKVHTQRQKPEEKRKPVDGADTEDYQAFADTIEAAMLSRAPWASIEKRATREMEALARSLPVWSWAECIRGFGALGLATIVAEAGDIGEYATHSKLWKRMGVAVIDGNRQGAPGKGASADDWIEHGYSPARRSRLFVIGDGLIKGNRDGRYRTMYLERKELERSRAPDMTPIHAHRRAQRYMEKRLLRDLWRAWRRGEHQEPASMPAVNPPSELLAALEGQK